MKSIYNTSISKSATGFLDSLPEYKINNVPVFRPEDFLVPELQATEEEKNKLESGLTNGEEPMDQDLSDVPTKCISAMESMEIK